MIFAGVWHNQWFADILTGLVVVVVVAIATLFYRSVLNDIRQAVKKNGGYTDGAADVAGRAEDRATEARDETRELSRTLNRFIGQQEEINRRQTESIALAHRRIDDLGEART